VSLEQWVANGWLARHEPSQREVTDLLDAARNDLNDARQDISPGWRFAIAYNAALRLCTAALQAAGYRAAREQKHYRTIAALPLLLGQGEAEVADCLDRCRARRHDVTYEAFSGVSETEAAELIETVAALEGRLRSWVNSRSQ
jgi:HEPN domain-containing protein